MSVLRASFVSAFAAVLGLFLALPAAARAQGGCSALPLPIGNVVEVTPSQTGSLQSILDASRAGDTIQLTDGVYSLPATLVFRTDGVTLRSKSGNPLGVVLDGRYAINDLLLVQRSNITIADLTVTRSYWHLVHVVPDGGTLTGTTLHNIRGIDGGEQFIKINPDSGQYADNGVIRCSSFEMTDVGRTYIRNNCYTGGIDMHQARGWQIYANRFSGFWCTAGLSEHAIHAWNGSRDTLVDRNVVVNSARGIGFGLGSSVTGRTYADAPCGGAADVGHYGGAITNNFVVANDTRLFASSAGFDTGIGLEQSCGTNILHNTVAAMAAPRSSSIEWRFVNTVAAVANNLVTDSLLPRDDASATVAGNVVNAPLSLFADVASGNLHLLSNATAAIDKAAVLATPLSFDIDAEPRGVSADVGADEYLAAAPVIEPPSTSDTSAPVVTILSPVNGQSVSKPFPVTVSATDNVGVSRVELYVDGALKDASTSAPFATRWNPKPAAPGMHTLQVKAYDASGNTAASVPVTVYR
jgi:hypothetical protein